jgi:hypothetical protein
MRTTNTTHIPRLKITLLLILPGCFIAGLLTYFILSFLYIPIKVSVALSIIISALIFGLNKYYLFPQSNTGETRNIQLQNAEASHKVYACLDFIVIWMSAIVISILVATSVSEQNDYVSFVPWQQMTSYDIIKLAVAIAFSFFLPGYVLLGIIDKNYTLSLSLRFLLSYLISIFFIALPSYIFASLGYFKFDNGLIVIIFFIAIFVLFVLKQSRTLSAGFRYILYMLHLKPLSRTRKALTNRIPEFVVFASLFGLVVFYTYYLNDGEIVVDQWFHHGRALLMGSPIYKDLASSESYKDPYTDSGSDITQIYPPIFSSLLAGFFDLSNSASVNAYVSIGFLNSVPVFGFYYFFTRWVPKNKKKAALLATTLFVFSSGFGWIYAFDLAIVSPPSNEKQPEISSINILARVTDTAYDIGLPTTFIDVGHPDITTPLIVIALPAGFALLGFIKEIQVKKEEGEGPSVVDINVNKNRIQTTSVPRQRLNSLVLKRLTGTTIRTSLLVTLVSFLGILAHDEFYLFIIIACVAIVVLLSGSSVNPLFQQPGRYSKHILVHGYSIFFSSFLVAIFLVVLVDIFVSPTKYYIAREIVGVPLISLSIIFILFAWATYIAIYMARRRHVSSSGNKKSARIHENNVSLMVVTGALRRLKRFDYAISKMKEISQSIKVRKFPSIRNYFSNSDATSSSIISFHFGQIIRLYLPAFAVSVIAFFYLFTFLVWSQLPDEDIKSQVDTENQWNVPWYLYPMKFGLTGLLGLAFVLSYLFKKFEKEMFIFLIVAVIALLAGPYYDEHRFSKYVMTGMASLAALLIYRILSKLFLSSYFIPLRFGSMLIYSIHSGARFKIVSSGILIGLIITFSGFSIFMFAGFVELFTNVADFNEGTRRDFPTFSEMKLIDFLNSKVISGNPDNHYNIALPEKEVDNNRGFLTKIYGFTPIPRAKLLQTPLVLNASTIETFYNLLDYSSTKFIILPKKDLVTNEVSSRSNIYANNNIIHFALENFQKAYEDDNFVVLEVPTLTPPSPNGDVALIYPTDELTPPSLMLGNGNSNRNSNTGTGFTMLPYNTLTFKEKAYVQHYYPLSMLALSKIDYNTYIDGDLSAFSKKYVIVPYDPPFLDSDMSLPTGSSRKGEEVDNSVYLDYVRNGGNLIVIDSDSHGQYDRKGKVQGVFSRLLSIIPTGKYARFDGLFDTTSLQNTKSTTSKKDLSNIAEDNQIVQAINRNHGRFVNISGVVEKTLYNRGDNKDDSISIKAYYTNTENNNNSSKTENAIVAPFIIEKKYGNGKITYVNAHGYFHTIFDGLSAINNDDDDDNNDYFYGNNKNLYFSTLANITSLIDSNLAKEDGQFSKRKFLDTTAPPAGGFGATKIRQILDNIQISAGYSTRINSSSLLLSLSDNSGDLAAKDITFTSSSHSAPFSATYYSKENATTTYDLKYTDMILRTLQSNNQSDENSNYKYSFKNAKIRNLKMYGSYEVIVESNDSSKIHVPVFPSFSDYVAIDIPKGFDITIKLSNSKPSYAEFEIIEDSNDNDNNTKANGNLQRLRISGDYATNSNSTTDRGLGLANIKSNEIHFHKTRPDFAGNGFTSLLMKSPQIQVKKEGAGMVGMQRDHVENRPQENVNTILTFKRDSPETEPIEIMNNVGGKESIIFRIDYVDSYSQPYRGGIKNHYVAYIEKDIKVIRNNINKDTVKSDGSSAYEYSRKTSDIKLPGDVSERSKRQGVVLQWERIMTSDSGLLLVISIIIISIIATKLATKMNSWPKLKSS